MPARGMRPRERAVGGTLKFFKFDVPVFFRDVNRGLGDRMHNLPWRPTSAIKIFQLKHLLTNPVGGKFLGIFEKTPAQFRAPKTSFGRVFNYFLTATGLILVSQKV